MKCQIKRRGDYMKLWIMSDLHQEFQKKQWMPKAVPEHDALILAGDTLCGVENAAKYALKLTKKPIVQICGNHEFYQHDFTEELKKLPKLSALRNNYYFVENHIIILNNIRFICASLWTNFCFFGTNFQNSAMQLADKGMNDYRLIKNNGRRLQPSDTLKQHEKSLSFITSELAIPFEGKTVIVTHHAPHKCSLATEGYVDDLMTPAYLSDLSPLIEATQPDLWIHGHIHQHFDYFVGKTRIITNPRGYEKQTDRFNPSLIVEV